MSWFFFIGSYHLRLSPSLFSKSSIIPGPMVWIFEGFLKPPCWRICIVKIKIAFVIVIVYNTFLNVGLSPTCLCSLLNSEAQTENEKPTSSLSMNEPHAHPRLVLSRVYVVKCQQKQQKNNNIKKSQKKLEIIINFQKNCMELHITYSSKLVERWKSTNAKTFWRKLQFWVLRPCQVCG